MAATDPVYTVSGARDHYREQSRAGGFLLERVPEFNNFFSEIPTHPSQTFRCAAAVARLTDRRQTLTGEGVWRGGRSDRPDLGTVVGG